MAEFLLDFERPIVELEKRIEELGGFEGVDDEVAKLQKQVQKFVPTPLIWFPIFLQILPSFTETGDLRTMRRLLQG
jgi:hypothetical protein